MNKTAMKVIKLAVGIISIGITVANNYLADKEIDAKIAKKVAEELANK